MSLMYYDFVLNSPVLLSALSKKSFPSENCPILAWSILRLGLAAFALELFPNIQQLQIPAIAACIPKSDADVHQLFSWLRASVLLPLTAVSAILTLNSAV
ncbi:MAG: hypothetical protein ABTQ25_11300 [Nitrosomonas ureae]